jgi:predicted CDP-diglyceride synthetase/phosphatidate cytidylyltransferase
MADKSLIDSKKAKMGLIGGAISGTITGLIVAWLTAQGIDPTEAAKVALAVSGTFLTPILAAITGQAFQDAAREKANGKAPIVKPGDPLTHTGAD